ncbi:MAG: histone deacetylase [Dehalococcoidia bacterium]
MGTGIVYDPIYLEHDTGSHPENSNRLISAMNLLESSGLIDRLVSLPPRMATENELMAIHTQEHIVNVQACSERGGAWLDGDTFCSKASYKAALYAAGGLLRGVDAIMNVDLNSTFGLVRPPGHHATRARAMGFCLFNNIAIAARYAQREHGIRRIMIVDFDVHHGNGTQEAFYDDPDVLYFSTHLYPFYPGTGDVDEIGISNGEGATVNVPLPGGCGDEQYRQVYQEVLAPVADRFQPEMIMVSAGYDPHWSDQLAMMQLSITGFAQIIKTIKDLADAHCEGRTLITLEGGYNLEAIAHGVRATFEVLLGETEIDDPMGGPRYGGSGPSIDKLLQRIKQTHQLT